MTLIQVGRLSDSNDTFTRDAYNKALNLPAQARARAQKAKAAEINTIPNPVMMNTATAAVMATNAARDQSQKKRIASIQANKALAAAEQAQRKRIASVQAATIAAQAQRKRIASVQAATVAAQAQRKRIADLQAAVNAATTTTDADTSTPLRMPIGVQKSMVGASKLVSKIGRSATTGVEPINVPIDVGASDLTSDIGSGDATTGVATNNVVSGAGKLVSGISGIGSAAGVAASKFASGIGSAAGGAVNSTYTGISSVGKYGSSTINSILSEENRHIFIHVMLAINFLFTFLLYTNIVSISGWFTETAIEQHPGSNKKYIQWALFWIEMVMLLCFVPYLVVDLKSGEFNLPLYYILVNSFIMIILLSFVHYYTFKKENSTLVASAFPYKNKTYFMPYYGAFISVLVFNIIIFISAFYQQFFNQS
jgi:hypothetical protein